MPRRHREEGGHDAVVAAANGATASDIDPRNFALLLLQRVGRTGMNILESAVRAFGQRGITGAEFVDAVMRCVLYATYLPESCAFPWQRKCVVTRDGKRHYDSEENLGAGFLPDVVVQHGGLNFVDVARGYPFHTDRSKFVAAREAQMSNFLSSLKKKQRELQNGKSTDGTPADSLGAVEVFQTPNSLQYALAGLFQEIDEEQRDRLSWEDIAAFFADVTTHGALSFGNAIVTPYWRSFHRTMPDRVRAGHVACFHEANRLVVATEEEENLRLLLLDSNSLELRGAMPYDPVHWGPVVTMEPMKRFVAGETFLAIASGDAKLRVYSHQTSAIAYTHAFGTPQTACRHIPQMRAVMCGSRSGIMSVMKAVHRTQWSVEQFSAMHDAAVSDFVFMPQRAQLAASMVDGVVRLFDADSAAPQQALLHKAAVHCLAFSGHFALLATGGDTGVPMLWVPNDNRCVAKSLADGDQTHPAPLSFLDFVFGTPQFLSGDRSGCVKVWDLRTMGCVQTIEPCDEGAQEAAQQTRGSFMLERHRRAPPPKLQPKMLCMDYFQTQRRFLRFGPRVAEKFSVAEPPSDTAVETTTASTVRKSVAAAAAVTLSSPGLQLHAPSLSVSPTTPSIAAPKEGKEAATQPPPAPTRLPVVSHAITHLTTVSIPLDECATVAGLPQEGQPLSRHSGLCLDVRRETLAAAPNLPPLPRMPDARRGTIAASGGSTPSTTTDAASGATQHLEMPQWVPVDDDDHDEGTDDGKSLQRRDAIKKGGDCNSPGGQFVVGCNGRTITVWRGDNGSVAARIDVAAAVEGYWAAHRPTNRPGEHHHPGEDWGLSLSVDLPPAAELKEKEGVAGRRSGRSASNIDAVARSGSVAFSEESNTSASVLNANVRPEALQLRKSSSLPTATRMRSIDVTEDGVGLTIPVEGLGNSSTPQRDSICRTPGHSAAELSASPERATSPRQPNNSTTMKIAPPPPPPLATVTSLTAFFTAKDQLGVLASTAASETFFSWGAHQRKEAARAKCWDALDAFRGGPVSSASQASVQQISPTLRRRPSKLMTTAIAAKAEATATSPMTTTAVPWEANDANAEEEAEDPAIPDEAVAPSRALHPRQSDPAFLGVLTIAVGTATGETVVFRADATIVASPAAATAAAPTVVALAFQRREQEGEPRGLGPQAALVADVRRPFLSTAIPVALSPRRLADAQQPAAVVAEAALVVHHPQAAAGAEHRRSVRINAVAHLETVPFDAPRATTAAGGASPSEERRLAFAKRASVLWRANLGRRKSENRRRGSFGVVVPRSRQTSFVACVDAPPPNATAPPLPRSTRPADGEFAPDLQTPPPTGTTAVPPAGASGTRGTFGVGGTAGPPAAPHFPLVLSCGRVTTLVDTGATSAATGTPSSHAACVVVYADEEAFCGLLWETDGSLADSRANPHRRLYVYLGLASNASLFLSLDRRDPSKVLSSTRLRSLPDNAAMLHCSSFLAQSSLFSCDAAGGVHLFCNPVGTDLRPTCVARLGGYQAPRRKYTPKVVASVVSQHDLLYLASDKYVGVFDLSNVQRHAFPDNWKRRFAHGVDVATPTNGIMPEVALATDPKGFAAVLNLLPPSPRLVHHFRVAPGASPVTAMTLALGGTALLVATSDGAVHTFTLWGSHVASVHDAMPPPARPPPPKRTPKAVHGKVSWGSTDDGSGSGSGSCWESMSLSSPSAGAPRDGKPSPFALWKGEHQGAGAAEMSASTLMVPLPAALRPPAPGISSNALQIDVAESQALSFGECNEVPCDVPPPWLPVANGDDDHAGSLEGRPAGPRPNAAYAALEDSMASSQQSIAWGENSPGSRSRTGEKPSSFLAFAKSFGSSFVPPTPSPHSWGSPHHAAANDKATHSVNVAARGESALHHRSASGSPRALMGHSQQSASEFLMHATRSGKLLGSSVGPEDLESIGKEGRDAVAPRFEAKLTAVKQRSIHRVQSKASPLLLFGVDGGGDGGFCLATVAEGGERNDGGPRSADKTVGGEEKKGEEKGNHQSVDDMLDALTSLPTDDDALGGASHTKMEGADVDELLADLERRQQLLAMDGPARRAHHVEMQRAFGLARRLAGAAKRLSEEEEMRRPRQAAALDPEPSLRDRLDLRASSATGQKHLLTKCHGGKVTALLAALLAASDSPSLRNACGVMYLEALHGSDWDVNLKVPLLLSAGRGGGGEEGEAQPTFRELKEREAQSPSPAPEPPFDSEAAERSSPLLSGSPLLKDIDAVPCDALPPPPPASTTAHHFNSSVGASTSPQKRSPQPTALVRHRSHAAIARSLSLASLVSAEEINGKRWTTSVVKQADSAESHAGRLLRTQIAAVGQFAGPKGVEITTTAAPAALAGGSPPTAAAFGGLGGPQPRPASASPLLPRPSSSTPGAGGPTLRGRLGAALERSASVAVKEDAADARKERRLGPALSRRVYHQRKSPYFAVDGRWDTRALVEAQSALVGALVGPASEVLWGTRRVAASPAGGGLPRSAGPAVVPRQPPDRLATETEALPPKGIECPQRPATVLIAAPQVRGLPAAATATASGTATIRALLRGSHLPQQATATAGVAGLPGASRSSRDMSGNVVFSSSVLAGRRKR